MTQNCDTFMKAKSKKREERIIEESKELSDITLANELLSYMLHSGSVTEIPEEIKFYIIKMLQEDLDTKEESLAELIKIARDKISIENLNDELELKLKLFKIDLN